MVTEEKIIEWLNNQEFFWLYDLKTAMGFVHIPYQTKTDPIATFVQNFVAKLKRHGYIQCVENKGCQKRYYRAYTIKLPLINQQQNA